MTQEARQMTQSELLAYMMPLNKVSEKECNSNLGDWQWPMRGLIDLQLVNAFTVQGTQYFSIRHG